MILQRSQMLPVESQNSQSASPVMSSESSAAKQPSQQTFSPGPSLARVVACACHGGATPKLQGFRWGLGFSLREGEILGKAEHIARMQIVGNQNIPNCGPYFSMMTRLNTKMMMRWIATVMLKAKKQMMVKMLKMKMRIRIRRRRRRRVMVMNQGATGKG